MVVDDSIVRGNTSKKLVGMLAAGAAEVHMRINSPEVMWPCFYGIDTDTQDQLIAANKSVEEICEYIGADSLAFISLEGLRAVPWALRHRSSLLRGLLHWRVSGRDSGELLEGQVPRGLQPRNFAPAPAPRRRCT